MCCCDGERHRSASIDLNTTNNASNTRRCRTTGLNLAPNTQVHRALLCVPAASACIAHVDCPRRDWFNKEGSVRLHACQGCGSCGDPELNYIARDWQILRTADDGVYHPQPTKKYVEACRLHRREGRKRGATSAVTACPLLFTLKYSWSSLALSCSLGNCFELRRSCAQQQHLFIRYQSARKWRLQATTPLTVAARVVKAHFQGWTDRIYLTCLALPRVLKSQHRGKNESGALRLK